MPKATLTFNLPEESEEHHIAINASKYYCLIEDVRDYIRIRSKTDVNDGEAKILERIKEIISE